MAEVTPVRRLALLTHGDPERTRQAVGRVALVCAERGVELLAPGDEVAKHPPLLPHLAADDAPADLVLVLGGDGTTLRALHRQLHGGTPVIGVNYGRVGFLTSLDRHEIEGLLPDILAGRYEIIELPCVEARLHGERHVAINDVLVSSSIHGRMALLDWAVNGIAFGERGCDGVVVATPSGSTAYNLSAGGPVLGWGVDAMVATFVAAHALDARPLVLARGHTIRVVSRSVGFPSRVVVDGHTVGQLDEGAAVEIRMAPERARLASLGDRPFLQHFRNTFAR